MSTKPVSSRQRVGLMMSMITLFAGVTGFVYQFMPGGTFLTFFVCVAAILGLANNNTGLDERDSQLLLQSYGAAFKYLFVAIFVIYVFIEISNTLNFAGQLILLINSHWIGIIVSAMCIFLGVVGLRNFRDIK